MEWKDQILNVLQLNFNNFQYDNDILFPEYFMFVWNYFFISSTTFNNSLSDKGSVFYFLKLQGALHFYDLSALVGC